MRSLLVSLYVVGGAAILVGCADSRASEDAVSIGKTREAIIGGTVSTSAQDATVMITDQGEFSCTGTLIAPNLVLTARHCVSQLNENAGQCGQVTSDEPASNFGVVVGVNAPSGRSVATGTKLYTMPGADMCGTDIALLQVDRDIPNAVIATVRFSAVTQGETMVAVGYGASSDDQQADQPPQRLQRTGVTVQELGPQTSHYTTKAGKSLEVDLAQNEFQTTESTCFGDSGGPLFDAQGQVVGVTSRGVDSLCVDRPTVWTGVAGYEQLISGAATSAGHPLPAPTQASTTTPASTAAGTTSSGDDDDSSTTKKKKASTPAPPATMGCSSNGATGRGRSGFGLGLAMIGLVLAERRRRRRAP
jgi:V8-like Glu-specific endopeptidase